MKIYVISDIHGNYKGLKEVLEKANFDYEVDQLISLGDLYDGWNESKEVVEELMKIKNLIFCKGNHDCLSVDTEVLTKRGWLKYEQIDIEKDFVIGINTEKNLCEWQKINKIITKDTDYINLYSNKYLDFKITDNHRLIHKFGEKFIYKEFKDLKTYHDRLKIPISIFNTNVGYDINNDLIKITAWVLTDGHITKQKYFTLYQSKIENIQYIKELLNNLGYEYSVSVRKRDIKYINKVKIKNCLEQYVFRILAKSSKVLYKTIQIKNKLPEWCWELNSEQAELFINEVIRGDGSFFKKTTNKCAVLYGTHQFLSEMQGFCNINGYSANISKDNRNTYRLNISTKKYCTIRQDVNKAKREYEPQKVWCLNVPFSNFLVRRNNKSYFTGNCWTLEYFFQNNRDSNYYSWIRHGGQATIESYEGCDDDYINNHYEFTLSSLPYYIHENEGKKYLFVHGGYNWRGYDEKTGENRFPIEHQYVEDLIWDRQLPYYVFSNQLKKTIDPTYEEIYIGHTPLESFPNHGKFNPYVPQKWCNVWLMDTGAAYTGCISLMNIETKELFSSTPSMMLYPDEKGRNKQSYNEKIGKK